MLSIIYTLCIGFPLCCILIAMGLLVCCTIVGIPVGLSLIALGTKVLTINPRPAR